MIISEHGPHVFLDTFLMLRPSIGNLSGKIGLQQTISSVDFHSVLSRPFSCRHPHTVRFQRLSLRVEPNKLDHSSKKQLNDGRCLGMGLFTSRCPPGVNSSSFLNLSRRYSTGTEERALQATGPSVSFDWTVPQLLLDLLGAPSSSSIRIGHRNLLLAMTHWYRVVQSMICAAW